MYDRYPPSEPPTGYSYCLRNPLYPVHLSDELAFSRSDVTAGIPHPGCGIFDPLSSHLNLDLSKQLKQTSPDQFSSPYSKPSSTVASCLENLPKPLP